LIRHHQRQNLAYQPGVAQHELEVLILIHTTRFVRVHAPEVKHRILLRGSHALQNHLELIDLGDPDAVMAADTVAYARLAHPTRTANQENLSATLKVHPAILQASPSGNRLHSAIAT
jgi:hypothetical protein